MFMEVELLSDGVQETANIGGDSWIQHQQRKQGQCEPHGLGKSTEQGVSCMPS